MVDRSRQDVIVYARTFDGLGAAPERREAYLALIAPIESSHLRDAMIKMSGCALVQRGILRQFIEHPRLEESYVISRAVADLVDIAREAGGAYAWKGSDDPEHRRPEPGDILVVGGGADGGGPEHAYMVLKIEDSPDEDGALVVVGLDGGQLDEGNHQVITVRRHTLIDGADRAESANDPGGGAARKIRFMLDLGAILEAFGREGE